jgi:hypothetical protein
MYIITIIVDELPSRTDDYVKGLVAHELSEMSYKFRLVQNELPALRKMRPKARKIMLEKLGFSNAAVGSPQYAEHERSVNEEAIRLGFSKEIEELEKHS